MSKLFLINRHQHAVQKFSYIVRNITDTKLCVFSLDTTQYLIRQSTTHINFVVRQHLITSIKYPFRKCFNHSELNKGSNQISTKMYGKLVTSVLKFPTGSYRLTHNTHPRGNKKQKLCIYSSLTFDTKVI